MILRAKAASLPALLVICCILTAGCPLPESMLDVDLLPPPRGRGAATLDEMLKLPDDDIDVAKAALLISRDEDPGLDIDVYLGKIDALARRLHRRLPSRAGATAIVEALNDVLLTGAGVLPAEGEGFARFDLARVLDGKTGNCLATSVEYLAVGQRLGLPIEGVCVPGHYFVRLVAGRRSVNIELTRWGATFPDSFYRRRFRISPRAISSRIYLAGDGARELLAVLLANRSAVRSAAGKFAAAAADARKALTLRPGFPQASVNLGRALEGLGRRPEAHETYRAVLDVDPNSADALNNLAAMYVAGRTGEFYRPYEAVELIRRAVRLRPNVAAYHCTAAVVYADVGRIDLSVGHMRHAVRIEPGSKLYREKLAGYRRSLLSPPEIEPAP